MSDHAPTIAPDFVGTPVHVAIEAAAELHLVLTSDDQDGPGLHVRTWPGLYWVTAQDIAPGRRVGTGARITVTFVADGEARSEVESAPVVPPPALSPQAEPEDPAPRGPP